MLFGYFLASKSDKEHLIRCFFGLRNMLILIFVFVNTLYFFPARPAGGWHQKVIKIFWLKTFWFKKSLTV
jgi:hypothetical protein